jgi:hypothetical protein
LQMYDFSDVEPQQSSDLIADGSFAKVTMTIRPGGVDGQTEFDRGLLKASTTAGSDVLSLDCEFTVTEAGSCVWHVVGLQRSVREWAIRQGWGGRLVRQEQAQGILVAALGMLATHPRYGKVKLRS